ncbi:unnamed protein product [Discosporangium mesarthrocarpum]
MRHFHLLKNREHCPVVNLDKIWSLLPEGTLEQAKAGADGKAPVVDVTNKGFFKVLGKGRLPQVPIIVRAKNFTKLAERKIKAAGGVCLIAE